MSLASDRLVHTDSLVQVGTTYAPPVMGNFRVGEETDAIKAAALCKGGRSDYFVRSRSLHDG